MLGERSGTGLEWVSNGKACGGKSSTMPAAPPPMITTFFLPSLSRPCEDIIAARKRYQWGITQGKTYTSRKTGEAGETRDEK